MFALRRVSVPRRLVSVADRPIDVQAGGSVSASERFSPESLHISIQLGRYEIRLAETRAERESACRLRFKVFNIELGEGLESSFQTGLDQDQFDLFCDHLIVEDRSRRAVVGTYRMQSGSGAAQKLGYYSEQEFDFSPYEPIRSQVLELGRASIAREHRTSEVLTLLWRGIVQYARFYSLRYLIGCSSLNSRDPREGWSVYRQLTAFLAPEPFRTRPARSGIARGGCGPAGRGQGSQIAQDVYCCGSQNLRRTGMGSRIRNDRLSDAARSGAALSAASDRLCRPTPRPRGSSEPVCAC